VDEKLLYDTFSAFGVITGNTPKCMRDPETGASKVEFVAPCTEFISFSFVRVHILIVDVLYFFLQGYAFVNYDCFEAADMVKRLSVSRRTERSFV
jgi:hypothetical protein